MKKIISALLVVLLAAMLCSCKSPSESVDTSETRIQLQAPSSGDMIAVVETDLGTVKAVLYPEYAPLAVENFSTHAEEGYYDGCTFHRVISDFLVQSGDPTGAGNGGESIWNSNFTNEYTNELHHYVGALGVATSQTDGNGSQFYIITGGEVSDELIDDMRSQGAKGGFSDKVIDAYIELGGRPTLDFRYTVFGQVYEGMDVVQKINALKTDKNDCPVDKVQIRKITIETYQD